MRAEAFFQALSRRAGSNQREMNCESKIFKKQYGKARDRALCVKSG
jgi:hypothetical protein